MWKLNRKLLSSLQVISCKEHKQGEAKGVKLENLNKQQLRKGKVSHFYFIIHLVFIICSRAKPNTGATTVSPRCRHKKFL